MDIVIKYPYYLLVIIALPLCIWIVKRFQKQSTLVYPLLSHISMLRLRNVGVKNRLGVFLRFLVLTGLLLALAQPMGSEREVDYEAKGIDIILTIDISGSMRAEDFQPDDRLTVAKEEARRFVDNRKSDRIGLVIFAARSYTQCPLTLDYDILNDFLERVETGMIKDGTAIGLALANSVNRLLESKSKTKVIILLTDGENNVGQIDPFTAAEIARTMGIRVYTIGVGRGGLVPYPVEDPVFGKIYKNIQLDVDEKTLKEIARITDGLYFRARDRTGLRKIYETIDKLEKTEIKVSEYVHYTQLYQYPLLAALILLLLELFVNYRFRMKIP